MEITKRMKEEQAFILASFKEKIGKLTKHGLFHKSSLVWKSVKKKGSKALLAALAFLLSYSTAFGLSQKSFNEIDLLMKEIKQNKYSLEAVQKKFNKIFDNITREIEQKIKDRDFESAKADLKIIYGLAKELENQELMKRVVELQGIVNQTFLDKLNLTQRGLYTDNEGKRIYVINTINNARSPSEEIRRHEQQFLIEEATSKMLPSGTYTAKGFKIVKRREFENNRLLSYCVEVRLVIKKVKDQKTGSIKETDATKETIEFLKRKKSFLPFG